MKKTIFILTMILSLSCSTSNQTIPLDEEEIAPKKVEIVLTTGQSNFDEIIVSYYDFDLSDWVYGPRQFEYDNAGNPQPIIISFPEYTHELIQGDAYRKNGFTSSLKAEIYVDDVLMFETETFGTEEVYAHIIFNYTIEN